MCQKRKRNPDYQRKPEFEVAVTLPSALKPSHVITEPSFIAPIPLSRLMAGR